MSADFVRTASGKAGDDRAGVLPFQQCGLPISFLLFFFQSVYKRMAEKACGDAVPGKVIDLERKEHGQFIRRLAQNTDTPFLPGPDLGSDVVENGNAFPAKQRSQSKIETGIVDQDGQSGFPAARLVRNAVEHSFQEAIAPRHLRKAGHIGLRGMGQQFGPRAQHGVAADAERLQLRAKRLQRTKERSGMGIAGGFPGDHQNGIIGRHFRIVNAE